MTPGPGRKGELLYLRMGGANEAQVRRNRTISRRTRALPPLFPILWPLSGPTHQLFFICCPFLCSLTVASYFPPQLRSLLTNVCLSSSCSLLPSCSCCYSRHPSTAAQNSTACVLEKFPSFSVDCHQQKPLNLQLLITHHSLCISAVSNKPSD